MNDARRRPAARGGWMLIEILVVLALFGVFALASSSLFVALARLERDGRTSQTLTTQFDSMLHQLRRDVWSARQVETPDATTLVLRRQDAEVTWRFSDTGARRATDASQQWPEVTLPMHVETKPGAVILSAMQSPDGRPARFVLVSQQQRWEAPR